MTNEEAMREIRGRCRKCELVNWKPSCDICSSYNSIGALEKQIPKKVIYRRFEVDEYGGLNCGWKCPVCDTYVAGMRDNYCWNCGNRLEKGDE